MATNPNDSYLPKVLCFPLYLMDGIHANKAFLFVHYAFGASEFADTWLISSGHGFLHICVISKAPCQHSAPGSVLNPGRDFSPYLSMDAGSKKWRIAQCWHQVSWRERLSVVIQTARPGSKSTCSKKWFPNGPL